jgi:hypothetical protein
MSEPTQPASQPTFDSTQLSDTSHDFIQPDSTHQAQGWQKQEVPSSGNFNWLFNNISLWIAWFLQWVKLAPGFQAPTAIAITANAIIPTAGVHSLTTGGTINLISLANLNPGRLLRLHGSTGQSVVLANLTGSAAGYAQMQMADGDSLTLNTEQDIVEFRLNAAGNLWRECFRSASLSGNGNPGGFGGRLTLTSGTPVTTTDVTAATTIYLTPFRGGYIPLWDGVRWTQNALSEISLAVPASTSQMYDLFVYNNAGTLTLEAVAWTNDTTRATALDTQNGVYVKSGDHTHLYVGSFRATGVSGQTEDSRVKRYLWNYYNRARRQMVATSGTSSWTYTTATWRQANADAGRQLDFVVGVVEDIARAKVMVGVSNSSGNVNAGVSIGLNSTTTPAAVDTVTMSVTAQSGFGMTAQAEYAGSPVAGRNTLVWLEVSNTGGTTTWVASTINGGGFATTGGLLGDVMS